MTSATTPNESPKPRNLRGNHKLLVGIALTLGVFLVCVVFSHRGLYQIYRFRKEKQQLEQEIARLSAENDRLARTIDRLQHDPEMIQDLIRRELNFVKKNEVIFQLPPETGAKGQIPPHASPAEAADPAPAKPAPTGPPREASSPGHAWATLEGAPNKGSLPKGESAVPGKSDASRKSRAAASPR
jgi:cell division protein FtsB